MLTLSRLSAGHVRCQRECHGSQSREPGKCHNLKAVLGFEKEGSVAADLEGDRRCPGSAARGVSWASTAVILPEDGGWFSPEGGCGHGPQGRPIKTSEGEQCSAPTSTKPKKHKKKPPNHGPMMMLIGGLGGHASSGENRWVEGAEWRAGGEVKLEQMSP